MQSKREAILVAACDIFSQKGFHNAKILDIAKTAGIGKGTVYEYFSSKSELFYEMSVFSINQYIKEIEKAVATQQTFNEKITAFVACQRAIITEKMELSSCINNGSIVLDDELKMKMIRLMMDAQIKVAKTMASILEKGQDEEVIDHALDIEFVSDLIVNMIFRFNMRCQFFGEADEEKLMILIMNGIGKGERKPD
jgi:AcrR family transcriptional regulator